MKKKEIKVIVKSVWYRTGGGYDRTFDGTFKFENYQENHKIYSNCKFFHLYLPSTWIEKIHKEFEKEIGDPIMYYDYEELPTSSINHFKTSYLTSYCQYPLIKLSEGTESECIYPLISDINKRDQMLIEILDKYLPKDNEAIDVL